jgi:phosphoadenosine phosphosulfate reductase
MKIGLQKKVDFGIKLIQAGAAKAAEIGQPIEIAYSGGKDSDCILELAKMAGVNYRAIYKNTTIDPPGTIKHAKEKGVEIRQPKITFLNLVRQKGMPTRRARFCCEALKEYKILDYVVIGVRRAESNARKERYKEPELCRVFNAKEKVRQYLPLLNWTDKDVADFIKDRGIQCHPLYYDEQGNFHVERRLGCIGCPLSGNAKKEYKQYPKFLKQIIRAVDDCIKAHPHRSICTKFGGSAYNVIYQDIFCSSYEEYVERIRPDLWGNVLDTKAAMENYFGIEL